MNTPQSWSNELVSKFSVKASVQVLLLAVLLTQLFTVCMLCKFWGVFFSLREREKKKVMIFRYSKQWWLVA